MEKQLCALKEERVFVEIKGFGIKDKKGRELGARWAVWKKEWIPAAEAEEGQWAGWTAVPGVQWEGRPHAMRGGEGYGAWHGGKFFPTMEAAIAAKEAYFAGAAKRAEKWAA